MAFVTIPVPCGSDKDAMRWASAVVRTLAEKYGVQLRGEHHLSLHTQLLEDPLNIAAKLVCSCGWAKVIYPQRLLTTGSPELRDALMEHVLSFTDPEHYTYYPAHAR